MAGSLSAEKLAFLTNVEGILKKKDDKASLISTLNIKKVRSLMGRKIIHTGMIPKVKSCIHALKGGVKKVHIVNGNLSHALLLEMFTDEGIGSQILK